MTVARDRRRTVGAFRRVKRDEVGFGLAELLVAMTIVAIILLSLAPFLISAFKTTARNVRTAGATELVNRRIDFAQSKGVTASCDAFNAFLTTYSVDTHPDNLVVDKKRSITYQLYSASVFSLADCKNPAISPTTYYFTVRVVDQTSGKELATASTRVAVPGFGS